MRHPSVPWYRICQVYGNQHENCDYMQKLVTKVESLYYTFCRSVGHDNKNCRAYDFPQERTYDSYFVKGEDPQEMQEKTHMAQPVAQVHCTPLPQMNFILSQPQQEFTLQQQFVPQPQLVAQPQYVP